MADYKRNMKMVLGELGQLFDRLDESELDRLAQAIVDSGVVFAAAAGRSGMLLRCAAMRLMHLGKPAYVVGEIVTPPIHEGDLLLIASGSGETGSLVSMAKKAKGLGAKIALVTANPRSTIAGLADVAVTLPAPTPKAEVRDYVASEQPMGNLFEQSMFITMDIVVMELMAKLGKTSEMMFTRHANLE